MDESLIPIDIHAGKLMDWLVSRRICGKDWMKSLTEIRQRIVKALTDMPENEAIAKILSCGSQLNYYTCKDIVSVLKETEADSKNIFGYYSSQRMKDWQEIVSMYEAHSVYLAEIAQTIVRNVSYEIPSLRKQVTKADAMIDGLRKKQSDAMRRSNHLLAEYAAMVSELGIAGVDPKGELTLQLSHFPAILSDISEKISGLKRTADFYRKFVQMTSNSRPALCPIIEYLATKGNTTHFEFINGEKPDLIEDRSSEPASKHSDSPLSVEESAIDFGDGIDYTEVVDFGDADDGSGSAGTGTTGSISDSFVHVPHANGQSKRSSVDEINWDISEKNGVAAAVPNKGKVARGVDALTVVEVRATREAIVHELLELQSFLQQRIFEMTADADGPVHLMLGSHLTSFAGSPESCNQMLSDVCSVLSAVSSDRLKVLYLMRENPKYCETVVRKLQRKTELSEKEKALCESLRQKELQLIHEKMNMIEQIPVLIRVTANLESKLTEDISARYKNRPVNIMAGAQVL